jgi:uncharacterized protein (TIGR02996 family)
MAAVATDPGLQGFFAAVREDPTDTTNLLVFADWLDDRGDPRAGWLRLAAQVLTLEPAPTRRRSVAGLLRRLHRGPGGRVWCGLATVALAARTPLFTGEPMRCVWPDSYPAVQGTLLLAGCGLLGPTAVGEACRRASTAAGPGWFRGTPTVPDWLARAARHQARAALGPAGLSPSACLARSSAAERMVATALATSPASAGRSSGLGARQCLHKATRSASAPHRSSRAKHSPTSPCAALTRAASAVSATNGGRVAGLQRPNPPRHRALRRHGVPRFGASGLPRHGCHSRLAAARHKFFRRAWHLLGVTADG